MRFAGALVCLLTAASSVSEALRIPESLKEAAKQETMRNPRLRKKEVERKNKLENQIRKMAVTDTSMLRQLNNNGNGYQNGYGQNYGNNNGNNNNNNNNNNDDNNVYQNNGNDYYNNGYNNGNYNWDQYMDQQSIGFDITSYSIKYTQCATVQTYSDQLAEDMYTDTVLAAQRFALFRLCPQNQCSDQYSMGCNSNYGEYLVSLDQFLLSMLEYQESRVAGYCEYCQNCAAIQSAKHFWKQVYNTRDYALEEAAESYQTWYTTYLETYNQNYANNYQNGNNANNYQNGNNANNYQYDDANLAAQRYYQQVRNSNNYANNYAQNMYYNNGNGGNYGGGNGYSSSNNNGDGNGYSSSNNNGNAYSSSSSQQQATQYKWTSQEMWQFQNNQNRQYNNQESWASMGSPTGKFFGKTILNGYYDDDGEFVQLYGYFNYNGEYVSLEDDELEWDDELFGEQPELWDGVTLDSESCSYQYAGSCYNQYDACMQILEDQDYEDYQAYQESQSNGYSEYQYEQARERYQRRATLKDFLGCVEVDPNDAYGDGDYANYQYAQNKANYQQQNYQYAQQNQYNCYEGDEQCEKVREYQEQMWEYNQKMYENKRFFIGTHCGSNARDISLAVYNDPYCSVLDENTDVATLLGYQPNTESIDLFPDECMPCMHDEDENQPWYEEEETYMLEPMCSMLYQFSGKCNRHLEATEYNYANYNANANNNYKSYSYNSNSNSNNYNQNQNNEEEESAASEDEEEQANGNNNNNYNSNSNSNSNRKYNQYNDEQWKQMYQSEAQAANEEAVCAFIDSLESNTYNENGEITISGSPWARAANFKREFVAESRAMNKGLMTGLMITMFAAVGMAVAACYLQGALSRKNVPSWKSPLGLPARRSKGDDPTDLARQNSGITMGRSRSGMGSAPLI